MAEQGGAIMLHRYISQFLEYCQLADFSVRPILALSARINEFEACMKGIRGQIFYFDILFASFIELSNQKI